METSENFLRATSNRNESVVVNEKAACTTLLKDDSRPNRDEIPIVGEQILRPFDPVGRSDGEVQMVLVSVKKNRIYTILRVKVTVTEIRDGAYYMR